MHFKELTFAFQGCQENETGYTLNIVVEMLLMVFLVVLSLIFPYGLQLFWCCAYSESVVPQACECILKINIEKISVQFIRVLILVKLHTT